MLTNVLGRVSAGEDLGMDEMSEVVDVVMQGKATDSEIAQLLTALRAKGEAVDEIAGAAAAMRTHMTRIHSSREVLVDTCGTGGSGSGTFNISTAAAIVTAASGVAVAKHGNRRITSKTGSADVLAELGVNVEASVATVERCLDELGIVHQDQGLQRRVGGPPLERAKLPVGRVETDHRRRGYGTFPKRIHAATIKPVTIAAWVGF